MQKFTDKYGPAKVRALSWKQPYASLMLHGKVETRTWDTQYRGWVLICASKEPYTYDQTCAIYGKELDSKILKPLLWKYPHDLPAGQAIAVGKLVISEQMGYYAGQEQAIEDKCFVKYYPDLWMHTYEDVQAIQPFDWKGCQGWKKLDAETIDKIVLI
jgi:hypothetical protein